MGTNGNGQFLESELIHRKVKVDNEWQTRTFPVVGGRLRLAHEQNDSLSLQTEMVNWDGAVRRLQMLCCHRQRAVHWLRHRQQPKRCQACGLTC